MSEAVPTSNTGFHPVDGFAFLAALLLCLGRLIEGFTPFRFFDLCKPRILCSLAEEGSSHVEERE